MRERPRGTEHCTGRRSAPPDPSFSRRPSIVPKTPSSSLTAANPSTVVVECNRAASEIFGYDISEMVGRPMDFLHTSDESLRKFQAQLYPAIETDEYFNLEHQMKRKDGSIFPSDHTVTALLDDRGKRVGWICTIRDITERKRAGDELRESELRLRILVEEAPVPISVSRNGIGLYANRKFLQMVGLKNVEESVGRPIADYFAPQSQGANKEHGKRRPFGVLKPSEFDSVFLRRDGSNFPVHVAVEEVQLPNGKANVAFVSDITERKRAEEALKQSWVLLRSVVDSQSDLIWSVDAPSLRLLMYNQAFVDYFRQVLGIRVREWNAPGRSLADR